MSLHVEVLSGLGEKAPAAILVEAEGSRLLLDAGGALHPGQSMAWAGISGASTRITPSSV